MHNNCFKCWKQAKAPPTKPVMKKFSLAFLQTDIEQKYNQKENEMQLSSLKKVLILINVYNFYNALIGEIAQWPNNYFRWIRLIIGLLGAVVLFLVNKYSKFKFLVQYLLSTAVLAFFFTISELIYANFPNLSSGQLFFQSTVNMISISYLVIVRIRWKVNVLVITIVFAYICFRFLDPFNFDQNDYFFNLLLLFIIYFVWLYLHYSHEQHDRMQFYLIQKGNERLKNYKKLMEDIMPNPILILPTDYELSKKTVFYNKSASLLFGGETDEENLFNMINSNFRLEEQVSNSGSQAINPDVRLRGYSSSRLIVERSDSFVKFIKAKLLEYSTINKFQESFANFKLKPSGPSCHFEAKFGVIIWGEQDEEVILLLLNDISSTKKIAELEVMNNNKDRLLATVSHDLRTPLNGLIGMLSSCIDVIDKREKELRKNLKISLSSAKILLHVINDLIDFSIITQNFYRLKLALQPIKLNEVISQVSKLVKFQMQSKCLNFSVENEMHDDDLFLLADEMRLKQILLNLLMNAFKYTTTGFVRLCAKKNNLLPEEDSYVLLSVEDTGCGISSQELEHLFRLKNIREEKSLNKSTGVGLGLTISQIFAKMHVKKKYGGIQVESQLGKGSKFYFPVIMCGSTGSFNDFEKCEEGEHKSMLAQHSEDFFKFFSPCLKSPPENDIFDWNWGEQESLNKASDSFSQTPDKFRRNSKAPPPKSRFEIKAVTPINVLVVDDDPINLLVASNYLKSMSISYSTAKNGQEAVQKIREFASSSRFFDAILMDCNMPIMDGYEASKIINEMIGKMEIKKCTIIAVTANTDPADVDFCFNAGMHYYLNKPLTLPTLKKLFNQIFKINFL